MPPRARSPGIRNAQAHYPAADTATFRDLLLFEERLKRNYGLLRRRKRRYQLYLTILVSTVLVLLSDVLLETDLFILPLNTGLSYYYTYARPYVRTYVERYLGKTLAPPGAETHDDEGELYEVYPSNEYFSDRRYVNGLREDSDYYTYYPQMPSPTQPREQDLYLRLPQYVKTSLLFIGGMTLFLFFASGMYSERVGYANKYVPHANKALRGFNMYLNVRTQPLPSRLSRMASKIGLSFLFPSKKTDPPTQPSSPAPQRIRTLSLSPSLSSRESSPYPSNYPHSPGWGEVNPIIPQIPPSSNPRGELIFSSRVHSVFREGYERYRDNYERKRQGGGTSQDARVGERKGVAKSILDRIRHPFGTSTPADTPFPAATPAAVETPLAEFAAGSNQYFPPIGPSPLGSSGGSVRGRTSSATPSGSRKSSPAPPGSVGKKGSKRRPGGRISRQGTPLLEIVEVLGGAPNEVQDSIRNGYGTGSGSGSDPIGAHSGSELIEVPNLGSSEAGMPVFRRRPARGRKGSSGTIE